jgi:hypothetical protein
VPDVPETVVLEQGDIARALTRIAHEIAERDGFGDQLAELRLEALGEVDAAAMDADDCGTAGRLPAARGMRVALGYLVCDPRQRSRYVALLEDDRLRHVGHFRTSFLASQDRVKGTAANVAPLRDGEVWRGSGSRCGGRCLSVADQARRATLGERDLDRVEVARQLGVGKDRAGLVAQLAAGVAGGHVS